MSLHTESDSRDQKRDDPESVESASEDLVQASPCPNVVSSTPASEPSNGDSEGDQSPEGGTIQERQNDPQADLSRKDQSEEDIADCKNDITAPRSASSDENEEQRDATPIVDIEASGAHSGPSNKTGTEPDVDTIVPESVMEKEGKTDLADRPEQAGSSPKDEMVEVPERSGEEQFEGVLEEEILPSATEDTTLKIGTIHLLGDVHYEVKACLPRRYYRGQIENDKEAPTVLFRVGPPTGSHEFWAKVSLEGGVVHPRLPRIQHASEAGIVLEEVEGNPIQTGLPLPEAITLLHGVCQLMRFLAIKGQAVTDIDLSSLIATKEHGLKLRYLPTVVPMGEPASVCFGDGVTPIGGSHTEYASERTSQFLWGAMLYKVVMGKYLPVEGLGDVMTLGPMRIPGMPQLLQAAMTGAHECHDLRTLMSLYRSYWVPAVPQYQLGAATTVGLNPDRMCNEDSYGIVHNLWEYHDAQEQIVRACVADGMGGEEAGEIASQAAVNTFCYQKPPANLGLPEEQAQWTRELGWNANEAVITATGDTRGGCTLSGVVIVKDRLTLAHVGDSRVYLYSREKGLRQLSRDHSYVQAMLDSGNMTEDEAAASPDTNQILRALGTAARYGQDDGFVDSLSSRMDQEGNALYEQDWLTLSVGETVLLMSDGIWGSWEYRENVISRELAQVIEDKRLDPQRIADALVAVALDEGADDNATVVVVTRTR